MEPIGEGGENAHSDFIRSFCAGYCERRYGSNMQDHWVIDIL
jgi:hypothetical protein